MSEGKRKEQAGSAGRPTLDSVYSMLLAFKINIQWSFR